MTIEKWGNIDLTSTFAGAGDHNAVAALPNGGYVMVRRDGGTIHVRVFDATGTVKASTTVGAATLQKIEPDVVVLRDGSFVVSWSGENKEIRSQKFSIAGVADPAGVISIAPVSASPSTNKGMPAMATSGNGWAVVWQEVNVNIGVGTTDIIRFERRNADGTKSGNTIDIELDTGASVPDVAELSGGRHVVTWADSGTIKGAIIQADGTVDRFSTNVWASNNSGGYNPSVTALSNGGFVIAIQNTVGAFDGNYITQVYDNNGNKVSQGSHSISIPAAHPPAIVALTKGGYAGGYAIVYAAPTVVGQGYSDNGDIYIRLVKADGTMSEAFMVNDTSFENGAQTLPNVTEMMDGRLSVTWYDPNSSGTRHQILDGREIPVTVEGSSHDDIYIGSKHGNDVLRGKDGNDTLYGGDGNDHLDGGAGADHFVGGDNFGKDNGTSDTVTYWGAQNRLGSVGVYLWDATGKTNTGEAEGDTFVGIEVISGTEHSDRLEGDGANNTFWGDAGNDTLKGFGGNDTLMGVTGADLFYGGLGADVFDGGTDNGGIGKERDLVTYRFSEAGIGLVADLSNSKNNTWEAAGDTYTGIDDLAGTKWDDTLVGLHADTNGASQNNTLYGEEGNDILVGGWGADTLDGGEGFNFASYITAAGGVQAYLDSPNLNTGEAAGDVYVITAEGRSIQGLIGSVHDDTLHGSNDDGNPGHNELRGGDGNDQLHGLNGHDTLEGGAGNDTLNGGNGHDLASYASSTVGVNVVLPTGGNGVVGVDTFVSIEGLIGSATGGDVLTGNGDANTLSGLGGNDILIGGNGADVLNGGTGSDTVSYANATGAVTVNLATGKGGGSDAEGDTYSSIESAVGSNFNDVFVGNAAINVFEGGLGDDVYYVSAGDVVIEHGNSGHDKVVTDASYALGANIQALEATGVGAVALTGNALNNTITGNAAGNWIDGGMGADTMMGGAGDDTYVIDNAGDRIFDDIGANTVVLTVNYDLSLLPASVTRVTVAEGLPLNLSGTNGANVLMGNAAANTLRGLGGNDKLYGKSSNDKLYGGSGKDTFIFDTAPHKTRNVDKIYDFKSRDDSFWLDNAVFTKLGRTGSEVRPKKFNSDMFVEGTRAKDREDRIVYDKKTGNLYYDADGTGRSAQVKIATLANKEKLYYHDFFVI